MFIQSSVQYVWRGFPLWHILKTCWEKRWGQIVAEEEILRNCDLSVYPPEQPT